MADIRPEPSMEDILASIKRIIADDNPMPRRSYAAPQTAAPASQPAERRPVPPIPPIPQPSMQRPEPRRNDDSILELTNRAPSSAQPVPPVPPVSIPAHLHDQQKPWMPEEAPAMSRVVDRLRQSEVAAAQARVASMAAAVPQPELLAATPIIPTPVAPAASSVLTRSVQATTPPVVPAAAATGSMTLDALVREMLRPMLTEWIDTHMPAIVERLVKQEISGTPEE